MIWEILFLCRGIAQGITNSNYFLTTSTGRYVLTVFEVLKSEELPFFLELNQHLSLNSVACAAPIARKDGGTDSILAGKPGLFGYLFEWIRYRLANRSSMFSYWCYASQNAFSRSRLSFKNEKSSL